MSHALEAGNHSDREGAEDWEKAVEAGIITLPDRINDAASLTARLASGTAATSDTRKGNDR